MVDYRAISSSDFIYISTVELFTRLVCTEGASRFSRKMRVVPRLLSSYLL